MVKKFLRVVPEKYGQVAVAIEMFKDMKTLTIEELVSHLLVVEERSEPSVYQITDKVPKLLLTEEEWAAKHKSRVVSDSSSGSGNKDRGRYVKKEWSGGRGCNDSRDSGGKNLTSMGTPRRKGRCHKCGIYGHYRKECKTKPKEEREEIAHHANADTDPALMVAQVCNLVQTTASGEQRVFLKQERVCPAAYGEGAWVLDTGATNHMTGCREALATLDETVRGVVRFGDGSTMEIHGIGAVTIAGRSNDHRVLAKVYFIPSLKCNIVSLGQLKEGGCRVEIDKGVLEVFERQQTMEEKRRVLIRAERRNHLYILKVNFTKPVCLMSKMDEVAWLWHARYGHLNFRSLSDLGAKQMVEGLPLIRRLEQVCDDCALCKHHRKLFPSMSAYRAQSNLELTHGDLCGPITPRTPGGKSYFLLIMDDYSRYMWLELLATKDEALSYIKSFKSAAEVESGCRLKVFRTDRGGEFISNAFADYCKEHGIKRNTTTPYTAQQNGVVER